MNKLQLNEKVTNKICSYVEHKINIKTALPIYEFATLFNVPSLQKASFINIERFFTMAVETKSFLELGYSSVSKILASSELNITAEQEIYNAVNTWLTYNIEQNSKFAKNLLLKVRFPLLSDHAIKDILSKPSSICKIHEYNDVLNKALEDRDSLYQNKSHPHYSNRYCNQKTFNIIICGGYYHGNSMKPIKRVAEFNVNNSETLNILPPMKNARCCPKVVCLKCEVYVFGGDDRTLIRSVEKYSPATKTWNKVTGMYDDREHFCACAFMGKVYVVGGRYSKVFKNTNSCLRFDTKDSSWKEVAVINEARSSAACAVFEGRIIVSGGIDNNYDELNSVEYYDFVADLWIPMSSMIEERSHHSLVVVKSKLFAVRDETCEVFDSTCKTFVALKPSIVFYAQQALSIGSKIFIFQNDTSYTVVYDVDNNSWSKASCEATYNVVDYSCAAVPLH